MGGAFYAGLAGAFGSLGKSMEDDKSRQENLNDYKSRLAFSETLQEKLGEKKLQLAQQYPTYTHFVTSPVDGKTTGFTDFGASSVLADGDPSLRQAFLENKTMTTQQRQAQALKDEAQTSQAGAMADYYKAKTSNPSAFMSKIYPSGNQKDTGISGADYEARVKSKALQIDFGAFAKPGEWATDEEKAALQQRQASARAKAISELDAAQVTRRGEKPIGLLDNLDSESENPFLQSDTMPDNPNNL